MTLEEALIEHCAPTIAGLKVANLFCYYPTDQRQFVLQYKFWQTWFSQYGLQLMILKGCKKNKCYLLYLYRQNALEDIFNDTQFRSFLISMGYDTQSCFIQQLAYRLQMREDFPHEIGIFLGYPLEDVKGFVENKGRNFTCCGYWKVYGNPEAANRCFQRYRKCTTIYKQKYAKGVPMKQLIVAA